MEEMNEFSFEPSDFPGFEAEPGDQTVTEEEIVEEPAEQAEEAAEGQEQPKEQVEEPKEEKPATPTTEDSFEIKVLGQKRTLTRDETIAMAQKGADYDRIHGQNDQLRQDVDRLNAEAAQNKGLMSNLKSLADTFAGGDVNKFVHALRVNAYRKQGYDADAAEKAVQNEDITAELEANKERRAAEQQRQAAERERRSREDAEFLDFARRYPEVEAKDIPQEVWAERNSGGCTLSYAYGKFLEKQEQQKKYDEQAAKIAALEQNEKNRSRSVGSAGTAGQNRVVDGFAAGFDAAFR